MVTIIEIYSVKPVRRLPIEFAWDLMEVTHLWPPLADGGLSPQVKAGHLAESVIDQALRNTVGLRIRLGLFDPIEDQPYWHVPKVRRTPSRRRSWANFNLL
jgi:hypothetical protein